MREKRKSIIITNIIRGFIIVIVGFVLIKGEYKNLGILAITMLLTFYDKLTEKILKIKLEEKLKIAIILFIFGAQCLGTVLDFYGKFLWWDTMLHTISGVIFFFIGETVIRQLNKQEELKSKIIILFAVCFAMATGVIWEIFEFLVDGILGQNMQVVKGMIGREAIMDTMMDLISVTIGTVLTAYVKVITNKRNKKGIKSNEK